MPEEIVVKIAACVTVVGNSSEESGWMGPHNFDFPCYLSHVIDDILNLLCHL